MAEFPPHEYSVRNVWYSVTLNCLNPNCDVLVRQPNKFKTVYLKPDTGGTAAAQCLWSSLTNLSVNLMHITGITKHKEQNKSSVQHGLHCISKCVAVFFLFLSVLSFGLFYGSFYNEVVLCDDQKLWCSSIVFKYLMSLKYGLKSVWSSHPAVLTVFFLSFLLHSGWGLQSCLARMCWTSLWHCT